MKAAHTRVLMLLENCSYPRDSRVKHEAETLAQAGYRVSVIAPRIRGQVWHENIADVDVYRYPTPPSANSSLGYIREYLYSMAAIFALSLVVFLRDGIDVVHAHNPPDVFFLLIPIIKLWGMRFVYDHHDLAPELYYARFGGGSRLVHDLLVVCEILSSKAADEILVTNNSGVDIAQQRGGVGAQRICVVRNGPDSTLRMVTQAHDPLIIAYVGSMGFHDGVEYLLHALSRVVEIFGRTDFKCVLLGDGDAFASLQSLADELHLGHYLEFRGWVSQEEVVRCLSTCDICAAPEPLNDYNDHSTMIKMMEYMAAGKPIVAFDLTEHRRSAGESAVYAHPNDVADFARLIVMLADDPERRQSMGRIGQQRITTELAWHYQAEHLLEAYQHLRGAPEPTAQKSLP